jgi:hypothetical protein
MSKFGWNKYFPQRLMRRVTSKMRFGLVVAFGFATAQFLLPAAAADNKADVPDLSGLWGRQSLDWEAPAAGPGPVVNTKLRPNGIRDSDTRVGDYNDPNLKPFTAAEVKRHGEISLNGETFPNPANQCQPQATPFLLTQLEIELLQQKDEVTILYMIDHHVRRVRLNQGHPPHVIASWSGDSIGHYEGDSLVIDTVGIKVGPFSMVDQYGTPFTESLHVIERYSLIDGQAARDAEQRNEKQSGSAMGRFADFDYKGAGLQIRFTVDDPGAFNNSWSAAATYLRGREWLEFICAESPFDYVTGKNPQIPTANKPDF